MTDHKSGAPWSPGRGMYHQGLEVVGLFLDRVATGLPDASAAALARQLMAIRADGSIAAVTDELRLTGVGTGIRLPDTSRDFYPPRLTQPEALAKYRELVKRAQLTLSAEDFDTWLDRPDIIEMRKVAEVQVPTDWAGSNGGLKAPDPLDRKPRVPVDVNLDGTIGRHTDLFGKEQGQIR